MNNINSLAFWNALPELIGVTKLNNPYPTKTALRREAVANRLLAEQADDTKKFTDALDEFTLIFGSLHFPLGSPAKDYDLDGIHMQIADWMIPRSQLGLETEAMDQASMGIDG